MGIKQLLLSAAVCFAPAATAAASPDWLYFDLGEVIVSGNPTDGYTYVPGAVAYLAAMRARGYKLALLTNIPESWGATCGLKFAELQKFLGSRLHETTPMNWAAFDAVVMPPFDRYRKPQKFMFVAGLAKACPGRALYVGEVAQEIQTAKDLGLATFHAPTGPHANPLPALATVRKLLGTEFRFHQPAGCDFDDIVTPILLPQDRDAGVQACVVDPRNPPR